jgi:hypothetical protein
MNKALALALLLSFTTSVAYAENCVQPAGMAIGPVVPTADAGREVYKTIAHIRHDPIKRSNDVLAKDQGDHWDVFQYPKHIDGYRVINGVETVQVVAGGGTLELEINKCDGRVLGSYAR